MSKHWDSKWHPHLVLVPLLLCSFLTLTLLQVEWASQGSFQKSFSVCDDNRKLYWSPEEITGHSKEIECPVKRN